jgi:hypothetical protein
MIESVLQNEIRPTLKADSDLHAAYFREDLGGNFLVLCDALVNGHGESTQHDRYQPASGGSSNHVKIFTWLHGKAMSACAAILPYLVITLGGFSGSVATDSISFFKMSRVERPRTPPPSRDRRRRPSRC